jgi:hypothetical protein
MALALHSAGTGHFQLQSGAEWDRTRVVGKGMRSHAARGPSSVAQQSTRTQARATTERKRLRSHNPWEKSMGMLSGDKGNGASAATASGCPALETRPAIEARHMHAMSPRNARPKAGGCRAGAVLHKQRRARLGAMPQRRGAPAGRRRRKSGRARPRPARRRVVRFRCVAEVAEVRAGACERARRIRRRCGA